MARPIYNYGDEVYLITDIYQHKRIVSGYITRPGLFTYLVVCGTEETGHFEFELSNKPDVMMTSTN